MYLSKLTFTGSNAEVLRALRDTYAMHRLLLRAFPDREQGGTGRVLYRTEHPRRPYDLPVVLLQSEIRPDWAKLEALADIQVSRDWTPDYTLAARYRFRLRATPTAVKTFGHAEDRPGKRRIGLYKDDEQRNWLERKGSEGGFEVNDLEVRPLGKQFGRSPRDGRIEHFAVDFEGILTVTDPEKLAAAVAGGIGPAKGFGFGLLSLARAV